MILEEIYSSQKLDIVRFMMYNINLRYCAENALFRIDESLSLHDFRIVKRDERIRLMFDVPLPDRLHRQREEIRRFITDEICKEEGSQFDIRITFDTQVEE